MPPSLFVRAIVFLLQSVWIGVKSFFTVENVLFTVCAYMYFFVFAPYVPVHRSWLISRINILPAGSAQTKWQLVEVAPA